MRQELTRRQVFVLETWGKLRHKLGHWPSFLEVAEQIECSRFAVRDHVVALKKKGMLFGVHAVKRGIVLTEEGWLRAGLLPPAELIRRSEPSGLAPIVRPQMAHQCKCGATTFRWPCPMCKRREP